MDPSKNDVIVFKASGAVVSIILLSDFRRPKQTEITSAFFVPSMDQKLTKIINFETGI